MSRDRSQVDLLENKRATEKGRTRKGAKRGGREVRDLDFLYYQFMPLHRLPIYSNLAEKRPVIVSASLSSACFPTSLVIHHRRCCTSVSDHPLSCSLASFFYTSFPSQSRFSSVERGGPHSCADGRCGPDAVVEGEECREWIRERKRERERSGEWAREDRGRKIE